MVGLVVVSHSRALAAGLAELVASVGDADISIAYAGGTGEEHKELGTDAMDIMEAIQAVDNPRGTVVLMDLGSAILSAETALEFLEGSLQGPVQLVSAPLVEGAVSAAVQIGLDSDIDAVIAEARSSLEPKEEQLGDGVTQGDGAKPGDGAVPGDGVTQEAGTPQASTGGDHADGSGRRVFPVNTVHGLHARPAAQLARTVGRFASEAVIRRVEDNGDRWVNARSLNRIATLQLRRGDHFELRATGADAVALLDAVETLVANNFGESQADYASTSTSASASTAQADTPSSTGSGADPASPTETTGALATMRDWSGVLSGVPASPGVALGPAFVLAAAHVSIEPEQISARSKPLGEVEALRELEPVVIARDAVAEELGSEAAEADRQGNREAAEIARAHETLLRDPELERSAVNTLRERACSAVEAYWLAAEALAQEYRRMDDPYLRARATDVSDVAVRLLRAVAPETVEKTAMPGEPAILVAGDLLPSQTMRLDPTVVRGIVTAHGTARSHAAIIARGLGIPMVTGVPLASDWTDTLRGTVLVVNGETGTVEVAPDEARRTEISAILASRREEAWRRRDAAQRPGTLADGTSVPVRANVATVADAARAVENGADGVGLLRTEFIFLSAESTPNEDSQVSSLVEMTKPFGERPVVIRLLDIGGDKDVPYLKLPRETNPFLGVRGVRLLLSEEFRETLRVHLRALLRVADRGSIKLMVPMVTEVGELSAIRRRLEEAHRELAAEGAAHQWPVEVGTMIETPAAALRAGDLARESAFFSIGTNDLTQYVMAAERGNDDVTHLSDGMHPAVLEAIRRTVEGARTQGIPVSVCGELGSDVAAIPILIGLGVESLSVNPAAVARTKERISRLQEDLCSDLATAALTCVTADEVRGRTPPAEA
ncbi:MAG: phosphoenolpyruvate--protein phosphotransferase [Alkalispirochaeta sp.]